MRETVVIPAETSANVGLPVRLLFVNLHEQRADWLTGSQQVKPGLLAARTLLSDDDKYAAVRLINLSGTNQVVRQGHSLGVAVPCTTDYVVCPADSNPRPPPARSDAERSFHSGSSDFSGDNSQSRGASAARAEPSDCGVFNIRASDGSDDDFSHIEPIIEKLPDSLTEDQRQQAIALIKRNADVFSRYEYDVGCAPNFTDRINTGGHAPIAEPLRRQARVHLDVIDEAVQDMQRAGIVEPCSSP